MTVMCINTRGWFFNHKQLEGPIFGDELEVYDEVDNGYSFVKWGIGTFWFKDEFVPVDEVDHEFAEQDKKPELVTI